MSRDATRGRPAPGYDLEACRKRIPLLASLIPMNNCSQAPQTDITRAALSGIWTPGIVPGWTGTHGWRRYGARVAWVPVRDGAIDPADYDPLLDDETAVVSACHGYYVNGFTQDLAHLAARAHAHGAMLYVDAYQTLGTMPVDVKALGVDFLASGNLKFLMGVPGIAFLYVRRELIENLHPCVTGWFGRSDPFAFAVKQLDWAPSASRFDSGTPPVMNAYVARAGMEMVTGIGVDKIRAWHEILARRLIDGGGARGLTLHGTADVSRKTATTAFVVHDSRAVETAMRARGVLPSARGPVIRLAPHFYNSIADVDAALDALAAVVPRG